MTAPASSRRVASKAARQRPQPEPPGVLLHASAWAPPAKTWRSREAALGYLETAFGEKLRALHDLALAEVPIPPSCVFDLLQQCEALAGFLRAPCRVDLMDETSYSASALAAAAAALADKGPSWTDSRGIGCEAWPSSVGVLAEAAAHATRQIAEASERRTRPKSREA